MFVFAVVDCEQHFLMYHGSQLAMVVLVIWALGATVLWFLSTLVSCVKARRGDYDVESEPVTPAEKTTAAPDT
jgi:hypothetical protein